MKKEKEKRVKAPLSAEQLAKKQSKKKKITANTITYTLVVIAGLINTLGMYVFILPNKFSPGGVTGIATMIYYLNPKINTGYMIFLLNVPLLIAAFFIFNRNYVIKTTLTIVFTSALLILIEKIPGIEKIKYPPENQLILPAIAGGCISGIAMGILFKAGGSNGGSEIIGGFINKKFPQYNTTSAMVAMDIVVVIATATIAAIAQPITEETYVIVVSIIIASIIKMFCTSIVCNTFLHGLNSALKFEIVTHYPDELSRQIIMELGRGVTKIKAQGGYTGQEKTVLLCVIRSKQISAFQRILKQYPDTFAYMMNTKEVYGRGFSIPLSEPVKPGAATPSGDIQSQQTKN